MKTTPKTQQHPIDKLLKIERRAQDLYIALGAIERKWAKAYDAARNSPDWDHHISETGQSEPYTFGDVIA